MLAKTDKILENSMHDKARELMGPAPDIVDEKFKAMCSGFATAIIEHFLEFGQVMPGIPTAGIGGVGATTAPGKLL